VLKYSLDIKQSAQKELDALDDTLFTRIDRKILALADNPQPGVKLLRTLGGHEGMIGVRGFGTNPVHLNI